MNKPEAFFTGTQVQQTWDSTSLGWLKECPRKYYYCMIEGWNSKHKSYHLIFGSYYHKSLELYDLERAKGADHTVALRDTLRWLMKITWEWESDDTAKNRETLVRSVVWYLDHFQADTAQTMILSDGLPAVELTFHFELTKEITLAGHLDRLVTFLDAPYIMDRKTTGATLGSNYFDRFEPDNQMSLYTLAGRIAYDTPVRGVIIDAAQIAVGFTRFDRAITYRTDDQLKEWTRDTISWIERSYGYVEKNYWPMNDKACMLCNYKRICSKDPSVRETFLNSDFEKRRWNPSEGDKNA